MVAETFVFVISQNCYFSCFAKFFLNSIPSPAVPVLVVRMSLLGKLLLYGCCCCNWCCCLGTIGMNDDAVGAVATRNDSVFM